MKTQKNQTPSRASGMNPFAQEWQRNMRFFKNMGLVVGIPSVLSFFLHSCAIPVTPGGGPRDTKAPVVRRAEPSNLTKNFTGNTIRLDFDEYVEISDAQKEIIITPPPLVFPEVKVRGKSVYIDFKDEKLQPNTTYSVLLGSAIRDAHEGNKLENYSFIFSTGSYIDSLILKGSVYDALSLESVSDVKAMLFSDLGDSAIYKKRPQYYTKVKSGNFEFSHLRKGPYRLYVLDDKNDNFNWDEGEGVAFLPEPVLIDSGKMKPVNLRFFMPGPDRPGITQMTYTPPRFSIKFGRKLDSVTVFQRIHDMVRTKPIIRVSPEVDSLVGFTADRSDSTKIWLMVYLNGSKSGIDTLITSRGYNKYAYRLECRIDALGQILNGTGASFAIHSNLPIGNINLDKIVVKNDSLRVKVSKAIFQDSGYLDLLVFGNFNSEKTAKAMLLPGALRSIYGKDNDTVRSEFQLPDNKNFGSLNLSVFPLPAPYPVLFQLVDSKGKVYYERKVVAGMATPISMPLIDPGTYKLRLIKDKNSNGRWDVGNVLSKSLPEEVYYYKESILVKANWELADLNFIELAPGVTPEKK